MPTESRVIHFANDEVFEALKEYSTQTDRAIPAEARYRLISYRDMQARVILNSAGEKSAINFSESELGAALLMFCIKNSIPVAKRSVKTIDFKQDAVALRLELPR